MRRVLIVIEKSSADYTAFAPDLPGCTASGATVEETRHKMLAALQTHLRRLQGNNYYMPHLSSWCEYLTLGEPCG